jgi:ARG and Rhodanese-Phosphatase-superfamily-associated Protein domain
MHNPIERALADITLGPAVAVENLVMFPLLGPSLKTLDYITLDDALGQNASEITEVSAQGVVPELRVINRGVKPTLIIDGEELVGAKQNRIVNLTILVAAKSELIIPVSCVEAGRWRAKSRRFTVAPRTQYATGRAKRMAQVSRSMASSGARMSDQSAVWADIAEMSARLESLSDTSAMEQMFIDHAASIDAYVTGCAPVDGQVGALFAIDDHIVGFDLFDDAATCRKLLPKLVRSYAVNAIDSVNASTPSKKMEQARGGAAIAHLVPGFLAAIATAPQQRVPAVGLGDDVRLSGNGLVGAALIVDDHVVHLSGLVA